MFVSSRLFTCQREPREIYFQSSNPIFKFTTTLLQHFEYRSSALYSSIESKVGAFLDWQGLTIVAHRLVGRNSLSASSSNSIKHYPAVPLKATSNLAPKMTALNCFSPAETRQAIINPLNITFEAGWAELSCVLATPSKAGVASMHQLLQEKNSYGLNVEQ